MKLKWLGIFLFVFAPLFARADDGSQVVVLYNSRVPASKPLAEYYAAKRHVPQNQIFGFALTTNEVITRADFRDFLQTPLALDLTENGLWKFGEMTIPAKDNQPEHTETRVVASKIRYAVLCWGMPLKIAPDDTLDELAGKLLPQNFQHNEAAVDSELAWLPLIKMNVPLTGPLPNLLYGCTNRAMLTPTNGILLVSRLDGPTPEIARGLVDKAMKAERDGFWGRAYFDARGLPTNSTYFPGDQWILTGAKICRELGFDVETDTNSAVFPASFPMSQIAIYAGWYAGNADGPFALPKVEFMPGAFAYHLFSFSASTLRGGNGWCKTLLAKGATCTMGCVYEPYLQFTPNIALFLQALGNGYTFGEAAWMAQPALSWQTTVIGDPLYQPFNQPPPELHAQLAREKNPLIEWSFNRLVNLDLVRGVREPELSAFLETISATAKSAVLTEKLANLYEAQGKPSSAILMWQRALTLKPTPEQRIRIRLTLGKKLLAQNRKADAIKNYKKLLAEAPDYPGKNLIEHKLQALEPKPATTNAPAH